MGDIGQWPELVDHAGVGRPGRGDHHRQLAAAPRLGQRRSQGGSREPAVGGGRHDDRLHAEQPQRVVDRGVGGVGDCRQPASTGHVAGDGERRQVAVRASEREAPAGALRHPGQLPDEVERLVLGSDRSGRLQPRLGGEARPTDDSVHPDRGSARRHRDERQVPRSVEGHRVVVDGALEHLPRAIDTEPLGGDRPVEQRRDLCGRRRAPERRVPQPLGDVSRHPIGKVVDAGVGAMQCHGPGQPRITWVRLCSRRYCWR